MVHVGDVLKTSGPADFKSAPGFENWPKFVGVIEQKKYPTLCASTVHLQNHSFNPIKKDLICML